MIEGKLTDSRGSLCADFIHHNGFAKNFDGVNYSSIAKFSFCPVVSGVVISGESSVELFCPIDRRSFAEV